MKKAFSLFLLSLGMIASCTSNGAVNTSNNKTSTPNIVTNNNEAKHTITWKNYDGTVLNEETYDDGAMPSYKGDTPTRPTVSGKEYTFTGWIPTIVPVVSNQTYTASFSSTDIKYNVVWCNYDGTELERDSVTYGTFPSYDGSTPIKPSSVFTGWDKELAPVTKNIKYTATFIDKPEPVVEQFNISIHCTDCTVNGSRYLFDKKDKNTQLEYHFTLDSYELRANPTIDFKVDGDSSTEYEYDYKTGTLRFTLSGNTDIEVIAPKCILMELLPNEETYTFDFDVEGSISYVDWGDGIINKETSHSYFPSTEMRELKIAGDLKCIFVYRNSFLKNVCLPNSVTSIGDSAFSYSSLSSITIPNSVTSIGDSAFSYCSSLASITIPDSVTSIGANAFRACSSLTIFCEPESKPSGWASNWNYSDCPVVWGYIGNGEYNNLKYAVSSINGNKTIVITGVINKATTSVVIPSTINVSGENIPVTSIGGYAFSNCSSLTSITIPDSVTSIGDYAFSGCSSLTYNTYDNALYLGNDSNKFLALICAKDHSIASCLINLSCKIIADSAFYKCSSFTSITIPNSVTSIGVKAFCVCSSLTSITIPNGVTSIGESAFEACSSLTSITIPNSITSIGDETFSDCYALTSITIPSSVTSIGGYAFSYCHSLTSITIPNSVTSIGDKAFYYCSSLTSITIPSSVTSIGGGVWSYACDQLSSISVDSANQYYDSRDNCNAIICTKTNELIVGCKNTTIPNSVASISDYAFSDCSSLTSITIPNSVTSIGDHAFSCCSSLTSITIPNGVTSIGDKTFYKCSSLTSITIPNSVTSIGDGAFSGCSFTSITIPNGITSIGDETFSGCYALTSITIPNSVTSIGDGTFSACSSLTSITIPNSVTSIGDYAFSYSSLTSITIPNSVTSMQARVFYDCEFLGTIYCEAPSEPAGWNSDWREGCNAEVVWGYDPSV